MDTTMIDDEEETRDICDACAGLGWVDVGDCEAGVTMPCPKCIGECYVEPE